MSSDKRKNLKSVPDEEGELDMSPMIDMVFLLLIFFVVNATAITVKKDKRITMPLASNSGEVKSANGCIVVNVYDPEKPNTKDVQMHGPNIFWGTDDEQAIPDENALREYITKKAKSFKEQGYELSLYLRGDVNSVYKNAKTAISIAAESGVSNVMFAAHPTDKPGK